MKTGATAREQLARFGRDHRQGQHVLVSGPTGSGKTTLARRLLQPRIDAGGFVVVFVCKIRPDDTIRDEYRGFARWTEFRARPRIGENRILLWPKVDGLPQSKALPIQREVFGNAIDELSKVGHWTVLGDEGLYMCSPTFLNLSSEWAMLHALGRSSRLSLFTNMQRPANVPLILYGSASHAFVGQTREFVDAKRLAELESAESSKELMHRISGIERQDFLWVKPATGGPAEVVNIAR